ncbi:MAG: hypothetical protein AUI08_01835 [Gemmatimonadetes bacterium 13_2_20CM_2_65_7]|nr:MAG: hypothetical protein AUI08_01835 [Gemmatimonadetes bacterium 13_2_20CM_2_65_7]
MNVIDLRSDTVTKPSTGIRRAMADAEVGDDVLDGDPTTRRLEQRIAALSGAQIRPITTCDGLLTAELVRNALRPASPDVPRISALAIENTHNAAGGRVLSVAAFDGVARARGRSASGWAEECGNQAFSPPPGSTRSITTERRCGDHPAP